ncbi:YlqD family protein [Bacillus sp. Marseille-P3661]|uniref:YlqD family protein n=1 Tax=Bacillus sp. Marseille-P3661 TaxID=1936234 RepID=UPI000C8250E1|nr:YlqD family protein [Bacillus sp. Marseille-P3661]
MKILKNVVVKQLLTGKSKQYMHEKFQAQLNQLNKEIEQFRFVKKKLEKSVKAAGNSNNIGKIEKEISGRQEQYNLVQFKVQQLELLPLGSELNDTEVQSIVEINEGDNWEEIMKGGTIIIKDGIIHEIR